MPLLRTYPLLILLPLLLAACGEGPVPAAATSGPVATQEETTTAAPGELARGDVRHEAWVDRLNVRATPNSSGKVVATLTERGQP